MSKRGVIRKLMYCNLDMVRCPEAGKGCAYKGRCSHRKVHEHEHNCDLPTCGEFKAHSVLIGGCKPIE